MGKRIGWVLLMMVLALATFLLQMGQWNDLSPEQQMTLFISMGLIVVLFIPPLVMSLFKHKVVSYVNIAYQTLIVVSFLGTLPIGFMLPNGTFTIIVALLGTGASLLSINTILKNKETQTSR